MMRNIKSTVIAIFMLLMLKSVNAQQAPETFKNPILPGYHPDPSICRVGDDYYLVTSTFVWYPGLPVYHSKDLVNWELIGHGLHRPDQVDYSGLQDKMGAYAATIRYHDGLFYIINTCVACKGNFYITAENPAGPWSDPVWIEDSPGIDPSLMWDDDGKCYYTGHIWIEEQEWPTQCGIWTQELDLEQKKLVGRREIQTYGHANNASYTEGAHLYKINGKYMLLVSEGGTGMFHALSVHHSDSVFGPYVADMINPVLTHRHLGEDYPIHAVGHGDLVQTQNGEWWCVSLGKRRIEKETILARETFLSKVVFEGQTPVFNPGEGRVLEEMKRPDLPWTPVKKAPAKDEFDGEKLDLKWCTIRTPKEDFYALKEGQLSLNLQPEILDSLVNSSILIQRIEHYDYEVNLKMNFNTSKSNEAAGLVVYRTSMNNYSLLKEKGSLVLYKRFKAETKEIARIPFKGKEVYLGAKANGMDIQFMYGETPEAMKAIGDVQSNMVIADGNGNQFNGPGIGMYATSKGQKSKAKAVFDWFEYRASECD